MIRSTVSWTRNVFVNIETHRKSAKSARGGREKKKSIVSAQEKRCRLEHGEAVESAGRRARVQRLQQADGRRIRSLKHSQPSPLKALLRSHAILAAIWKYPA